MLVEGANGVFSGTTEAKKTLPAFELEIHQLPMDFAQTANNTEKRSHDINPSQFDNNTISK